MMNPKRNKKAQLIIAIVAIILVAAMILAPILSSLRV